MKPQVDKTKNELTTTYWYLTPTGYVCAGETYNKLRVARLEYTNNPRNKILLCEERTSVYQNSEWKLTVKEVS